MTKKAKAEKEKRTRVMFRVQSTAESDVHVTGSFNGWKPTEKKLHDKSGTGDFSRVILLAPGRHEYKFLINGEWAVDSKNPEWTTNDQGSLNSVLMVGSH